MLGIGLFVNKRFYGDETLLKLIIIPREESSEKLILEFKLEQKNDKVFHSRCMDSFYRL